MRRIVVRLFAAVAVLLLAACRSSAITVSDKRLPKPPPEQTQMVFLRPTSSSLFQVSVYMLGEDQRQQQFLGLVSPSTKLACRVPPGDHLFMIVSNEEAEFMEARLDAGKTYYALVRSRYDKNMDWHFFLLPIHRESADKYNIHSPDFRKWKRLTRLVEDTADADQWYAENLAAIEKLRGLYINGWNQRSVESKAKLTLNPEDGIGGPEPEARSGDTGRAGALEQPQAAQENTSPVAR